MVKRINLPSYDYKHAITFFYFDHIFTVHIASIIVINQNTTHLTLVNKSLYVDDILPV